VKESPMNWWVTQAGREPVGPVSTDLVVRGIAAGRVPDDALVCQVGGTKWLRLLDVAEFARELERRQKGPRLDLSAEQTVFELAGPPPSEPPPGPRTDPTGVNVVQPDDFEEHTIVDLAPKRSEPSRG
jgi:hypothetical protein